MLELEWHASIFSLPAHSSVIYRVSVKELVLEGFRLACQHGSNRPRVRVLLRLGLVLPLRPLRYHGVDALPLRLLGLSF